MYTPSGVLTNRVSGVRLIRASCLMEPSRANGSRNQGRRERAISRPADAPPTPRTESAAWMGPRPATRDRWMAVEAMCRTAPSNGDSGHREFGLAFGIVDVEQSTAYRGGQAQ